MTTPHDDQPTGGESPRAFELHIDSGVTKDLVPFCGIYLIRDGEETRLGQLSPNQVREMALQWMGAAEAATSDALIAGMLTEAFGLDLEAVAQALGFTREFRNRADAAGDEHANAEMTIR